MEASIINILQLLIVKTGLDPAVTLLLLLIGIMIICYRFVVKPMYEKIKKIPSEDTLKDTLKETINNSKDIKELHLDEISKKLDEMSDALNNVKQKSVTNDKSINQLQHDVEYIKEILTQFQGHLMYSNSHSFGNKELR